MSLERDGADLVVALGGSVTSDASEWARACRGDSLAEERGLEKDVALFFGCESLGRGHQKRDGREEEGLQPRTLEMSTECVVHFQTLFRVVPFSSFSNSLFLSVRKCDPTSLLSFPHGAILFAAAPANRRRDGDGSRDPPRSAGAVSSTARLYTSPVWSRQEAAKHRRVFLETMREMPGLMPYRNNGAGRADTSERG